MAGICLLVEESELEMNRNGRAWIEANRQRFEAPKTEIFVPHDLIRGQFQIA